MILIMMEIGSKLTEKTINQEFDELLSFWLSHECEECSYCKDLPKDERYGSSRFPKLFKVMEEVKRIKENSEK